MTGESVGKRFRFTDNLILFVIVVALSGAIALVINSFVASVGAAYTIVHRHILRGLERRSLHRRVPNSHDENGSAGPRWHSLLRQVWRFVVDMLLRHPVRFADTVSGPISLTIGVLLMAGLLHLALSGTLGITITAITLIIMTVVDGTKHGYRRFLGITFLCAIAFIGIVIWVLVAIYLETNSP